MLELSLVGMQVAHEASNFAGQGRNPISSLRNSYNARSNAAWTHGVRRGSFRAQ
jgi:hypothetical protein